MWLWTWTLAFLGWALVCAICMIYEPIHCSQPPGVGGFNSTRNFCMRWRIHRWCCCGALSASPSPVLGLIPAATPGMGHWGTIDSGPINHDIHNHCYIPICDGWDHHIGELSPDTQKALESQILPDHSSAFPRHLILSEERGVSSSCLRVHFTLDVEERFACVGWSLSLSVDRNRVGLHWTFQGYLWASLCWTHKTCWSVLGEQLVYELCWK